MLAVGESFISHESLQAAVIVVSQKLNVAKQYNKFTNSVNKSE